MQQTLFSLAAVFSFSILGYTMHQNTIETEREAYADQIEAAAFDFALLTSNHIKRLAFDEADVERTDMRSEHEVADLTPPDQLGGDDPSERRLHRLDDIDDLRDVNYQKDWDVGNGQVRLRATFHVEYVDPMDFSRVVTDRATTAKMVTITVVEPRAQRARDRGERAPTEVTLKVPLTPSKLYLHH